MQEILKEEHKKKQFDDIFYKKGSHKENKAVRDERRNEPQKRLSKDGSGLNRYLSVNRPESSMRTTNQKGQSHSKKANKDEALCNEIPSQRFTSFTNTQ